MELFNPKIEVADDGLIIPKVGMWSHDKFRLVSNYCNIFTSGMKNKWNQLVYVDLFAGAGYAMIDDTKKIYLNSALLALSVPQPFTKYILCEKDPEKFEALRTRVKRDFGHRNCVVLNHDSNSEVSQIVKELPSYSKTNTRLVFSFVDPYNLELNFDSIKVLGAHQVDFLILQALHMDGNRNADSYYRNKSNDKIAKYLGDPNWRVKFDEHTQENGKKFVQFLANQFHSQMVNLGYQKKPLMNQVRSSDKNLALYYLSFYSKHSRGEEFFKKVQNSHQPQLNLGF